MGLVLVGVVAVWLVASGCQQQQKVPGDYQRAWAHRRVMDAEVQGLADDMDAVFLTERATRMTPWYNP